jgi:hypothetical protein
MIDFSVALCVFSALLCGKKVSIKYLKWGFITNLIIDN